MMLNIKSENGTVNLNADGALHTLMADFTIMFEAVVDMFVDEGMSRDFVVRSLAQGISCMLGYMPFPQKEADHANI